MHIPAVKLWFVTKFLYPTHYITFNFKSTVVNGDNASFISHLAKIQFKMNIPLCNLVTLYNGVDTVLKDGKCYRNYYILAEGPA